MAVEARFDADTRPGAFKRVADQLGIHPETLRTLVQLSSGSSRSAQEIRTLCKDRLRMLHPGMQHIPAVDPILRHAHTCIRNRI